MLYDHEIIEITKNWNLQLRVLKHAMLHQLVLMLWVYDSNHPLVKEYKMFSFDAIHGFIHGNPIDRCKTDVNVADEALEALIHAIDRSLTSDLDKDLRFSDATDGFVTRTYLCLAAVMGNETFPRLSDSEISHYFSEIVEDEKEMIIFSKELSEMAIKMGEKSMNLISAFLLANPETSQEFQKITHSLGERENEPMIKPDKPRYCLIDRMATDDTLERIEKQEGPYQKKGGTIVSSFNPLPPYVFDPVDSTTYYIKRLRNMFKTVEKRSLADQADQEAILFSIKTWMIQALNNHAESNPVRALYIMSAILTEFTKGLSKGIFAQALKTEPDFLTNIRIMLKDALSLTLYFMEYVPEEAYIKVSKRLKRFMRDYKNEELNLIDFKPFVDYYTKRSKIIDQSLN